MNRTQFLASTSSRSVEKIKPQVKLNRSRLGDKLHNKDLNFMHITVNLFLERGNMADSYLNVSGFSLSLSHSFTHTHTHTHRNKNSDRLIPNII